MRPRSTCRRSFAISDGASSADDRDSMLAPDIPLTTFATLASPAVAHGVSTRAGGVSVGPYASLNLGASVGDSEDAVLENRARLARSLGFAPERLVTTPMVHGKAVLVVDDATAPGALAVRADILVTREPGYLLMLRVADCVPILLSDESAGVVGVAHAGWRGTAIGVAGRAVEAVTNLGTDPGVLKAVIGPSIGPCCFEVGEEVVAAFPDANGARSVGPRGRSHLDLWELNRRQLVAAGVLPTRSRCLAPAPAVTRTPTSRTARLAIRPGDSGRPSGCAPMPDLRGNIERVRASIADAAARAGRDPASVTLVGVSKTQPAELVAEASRLASSTLARTGCRKQTARSSAYTNSSGARRRGT